MAKKELDWSAIGQLLSIIQNLFTTARDTLKKMGIGIEIIPWLAKDGKEVFAGLYKRAGEKYLETKNAVAEKAEDFYDLMVDYAISVEELVKLGKYDWFNDDITSKNFPTTRVGQAEIITKLFHFNRIISSEDAIMEMDKEGYRPAELHELLVFGSKHPELQLQFPIIALGSAWRDLDGFRYVAYLYRRDSDRELGLNFFDSGWNDNCRFLAVRNFLCFPHCCGFYFVNWISSPQASFQFR